MRFHLAEMEIEVEAYFIDGYSTCNSAKRL